ncbi:MAG: trypsin-like peptidase domain-containing protein [Peptococcaceae bacterium]|nr:trypsin-like peptidase domain-containing protein [Peptococcaceae bacterium]
MYEFEERRSSLRRGLANILYTLMGSIVGGVIVFGLLAHGSLVASNQEFTARPLSQAAVPIVPSRTTFDTIVSPVVGMAAAVSPAVVGIISKGGGTDSHPWAAVGGGSGSGVVFDQTGYIVTNNHVVDGAQEVEVDLADGRMFAAKVIGTDPRTDLAVLKIAAANLPAANFGDSDKLQVGELVAAIGNPLGEQYYGSVTAGIVSATRRTVSVGDSQYIDLLQTDAAINPGNSGGALVNSRGEVIGINSVKISGDKVEGMGFAIPSNTVIQVTRDLVQNGKVTRPWLGVVLQSDVTSMTAPPPGPRMEW